MITIMAMLFVLPTGDAVIRRPAGGSEIVVTATRRLAGAVHSLTWNGRAFIDSLDHGRQLQSACAFDGGKPGEFWAECFNPTEAGSRRDHTGPTSTSRVLKLDVRPDSITTVSRMAFWLAPGEKSFGRPALNTAMLSDHTLAKRLALGVDGNPHRIRYEATFRVPADPQHGRGQFEAVTGYMPSAFDTFHTLDPATGKLAPLSDGPGEQPLPVVFSTADGRHAMGVVGDPAAGRTGPGYGRWRFAAEKVVKWNVVYRTDRPAGEYAFRMTLAVGTREDVRRALSRSK